MNARTTSTTSTLSPPSSWTSIGTFSGVKRGVQFDKMQPMFGDGTNVRPKDSIKCKSGQYSLSVLSPPPILPSVRGFDNLSKQYFARHICSNLTDQLQVANREQCVLCPAGSYCIDRLTAVPCPEGTYSAESGQQVCSPCDGTSYSGGSGASTCKPCAAYTERKVCENELHS